MNQRFRGCGWAAFARKMVTDYPSSAPDSLRGHLNYVEISRIIVGSLAAGGLVFVILGSLTLQTGMVLPAPADSGLAVAVLALILESHRRLKHGDELPIDRRNKVY